MSGNDKPSADKAHPSPNIQGEGDYDSARRFDTDEERFVKSADVADLARKAAPKSKEEAADLAKAEEIGRSHSVAGKEGSSKAGSRATPTPPRD